MLSLMRSITWTETRGHEIRSCTRRAANSRRAATSLQAGAQICTRRAATSANGATEPQPCHGLRSGGGSTSHVNRGRALQVRRLHESCAPSGARRLHERVQLESTAAHAATLALAAGLTHCRANSRHRPLHVSVGHLRHTACWRDLLAHMIAAVVTATHMMTPSSRMMPAPSSEQHQHTRAASATRAAA